MKYFVVNFVVLIYWFCQLLTITISEISSDTLNATARQDRRNLLQRHFRYMNKKDGSVRLIGGRVASEGNIEIFHDGKYGSICDDDWGKNEATVGK